jgi:hypothetical protein
MTNMPRTQQLQVAVVFTSEEVAADVRDRRPECIALFGDLDEAQRERLVLDAWSIGLRALHNAHAAGQEARLKEVGASLLADIDRQLRAHVEQQQATIGSVLARFFDPNDGQVSQRLAAFVDDQGVLARLLNRYLGPQNSVLAEALARQVGETSPLFKRLSPTESNGLVKVLEAELRTVMGQSHASRDPRRAVCLRRHGSDGRRGPLQERRRGSAVHVRERVCAGRRRLRGEA